jgi:hypothetical protein
MCEKMTKHAVPELARQSLDTRWLLISQAETIGEMLENLL